MRRIKACEKLIDWLDPMHEIAMEKTGLTGLTDFGEDKYYMLG